MGSKKGKGTLADQIARLEGEVGDEGIKRAKKLAETDSDVVKLAFKYIDRPYRQPQGLRKSERRVYFQLIQDAGQAAADKYRNARLAERDINPKNVGPEPPPTDAEKGSEQEPAAVAK